MKKNIVWFALSAILLTAVLSSCKKGASGCRPIRFYTTDSFSVSSLSYDGDHVIRVDSRLKAGTSQGYSLYHYSATGKISGFEDYDSTGVTLRKTEYIFDGNDRVISEYYYVKTGSTLPLSAHYSYEYYMNGNLQKLTRYDNGTTVLETHYYTDYDANGNNTKGYDNNNLGVTRDTFFYTYDDHPNFWSFYFLKGPQNKNNPLSYTYKPTVGPVFIDTYTYLYNGQGYVTYQHESADGDNLYVDYSCGN